MPPTSVLYESDLIHDLIPNICFLQFPIWRNSIDIDA